MTRFRSLTPRLTLVASVLLAAVSVTSLRSPLFSLNSSSEIQFVPPPPPDLGEPSGRPEGGGSRGCESIALAPQTPVGYWGQTTAAHPTFWFRLATGRDLTRGDRLAFVLKDEANQEVYKTDFAAPNIPPGIIRLALPHKVKALQVSKIYRWEFSIRCDAEATEDRPSRVQGRIQRIEVSSAISQQITAASTPLEKAKIYAANGIWYDSITLLGNELQPELHPAPATLSAWNSLMQQINLTNFSSIPFVPCCSF